MCALSNFWCMLPAAVLRCAFSLVALQRVLCTSGFVDDVMYAHNGLTYRRSEPGVCWKRLTVGSIWGEVWWTQFPRWHRIMCNQVIYSPCTESRPHLRITSGIAGIPRRRHRYRHEHPRADPRRHVRHARFPEVIQLWQAERHADILATILARMSVSVSVSVSASWNAGLYVHEPDDE